MFYNQEITPWQIQNQDEPYIGTLRSVSKSQRRSMILPARTSLHPLTTPVSPRMEINSPETAAQSQSSSPKNPIINLRIKRLSLAEVVNKRISGQDVLVIPPINYNSVEFNSVPRLYGQLDFQVKALTKRKVQELEEFMNERKEKQQRLKQQIVPLQIIPQIKSAPKLDRRYKSKSLNTLHNHIKYYKQKHRQKQNDTHKGQPVKFDSLQDIIKRLPKIDNREQKKPMKNSQSTIKSQTFHTIKFMQPFQKAIRIQKKSIIRGKQEHVIDRLFQRMVERKKQ